MGDLVSGRYPLTYPFVKALGGASNVAQSNIADRSNLEWTGINDVTDAAASLVSGKLTIVAIPVEIGDLISKVSIVTGVTAESGGSHAWGACFAGTPTTSKLLGQSADATGSAAVAASTRHDFALATPFIVTVTDAPNGYIFAGASITGTVASLLSTAIAVAAQYAWFPNSPPFFAGKFGSALGASAPSSLTLATVTKLATPPAVFLS